MMTDTEIQQRDEADLAEIGRIQRAGTVYDGDAWLLALALGAGALLVWGVWTGGG